MQCLCDHTLVAAAERQPFAYFATDGSKVEREDVASRGVWASTAVFPTAVVTDRWGLSAACTGLQASTCGVPARNCRAERSSRRWWRSYLRHPCRRMEAAIRCAGALPRQLVFLRQLRRMEAGLGDLDRQRVIGGSCQSSFRTGQLPNVLPPSHTNHPPRRLGRPDGASSGVETPWIFVAVIVYGRADRP